MREGGKDHLRWLVVATALSLLFFLFFITLGLEMSDTQVYELYIRDLFALSPARGACEPPPHRAKPPQGAPPSVTSLGPELSVVVISWEADTI